MHASGRLVVAALASAVALLLGATPAFGDGTGDAWTDGGHIGTEATSGRGGEATPASSGGGPDCSWDRLEGEYAATSDRMAANGIGPARGPEPGSWFRRLCHYADGTSTATIQWVTDTVDIAALAQQASDSVPIPAPGIRMNPTPAEGALVNTETWLWVDGWGPVSAQASAGNIVVTATATPRRVAWDMGNGDRVTCDGPGTPYDRTRPSAAQSTSCSYTYRQSSARAADGAFTVTATVMWDVTWSVTGAPGGGALGAAPRSEQVRLPVKEIQAVNR